LGWQHTGRYINGQTIRACINWHHIQHLIASIAKAVVTVPINPTTDAACSTCDDHINRPAADPFLPSTSHTNTIFIIGIIAIIPISGRTSRIGTFLAITFLIDTCTQVQGVRRVAGTIIRKERQVVSCRQIAKIERDIRQARIITRGPGGTTEIGELDRDRCI
jgi:hypothetical protein